MRWSTHSDSRHALQDDAANSLHSVEPSRGSFRLSEAETPPISLKRRQKPGRQTSPGGTPAVTRSCSESSGSEEEGGWPGEYGVEEIVGGRDADGANEIQELPVKWERRDPESEGETRKPDEGVKHARKNALFSVGERKQPPEQHDEKPTRTARNNESPVFRVDYVSPKQQHQLEQGPVLQLGGQQQCSPGPQYQQLGDGKPDAQQLRSILPVEGLWPFTKSDDHEALLAKFRELKPADRVGAIVQVRVERDDCNSSACLELRRGVVIFVDHQYSCEVVVAYGTEELFWEHVMDVVLVESLPTTEKIPHISRFLANGSVMRSILAQKETISLPHLRASHGVCSYSASKRWATNPDDYAHKDEDYFEDQETWCSGCGILCAGTEVRLIHSMGLFHDDAQYVHYCEDCLKK